MWFLTIAPLAIKLYTENCNAQVMYLLGPRCTIKNSVTDWHQHFYSSILDFNADLVFSLPLLNSCLHRKCIFCVAQLRGCIFADVKEERKMSTYSMWVRVCCESCTQYILAMGAVKCCGVGNSHELLSHSLVFFLTQYLWNVDEYELSFCPCKLVWALWSIWRW